MYLAILVVDPFWDGENVTPKIKGRIRDLDNDRR